MKAMTSFSCSVQSGAIGSLSSRYIVRSVGGVVHEVDMLGRALRLRLEQFQEILLVVSNIRIPPPSKRVNTVKSLARWHSHKQLETIVEVTGHEQTALRVVLYESATASRDIAREGGRNNLSRAGHRLDCKRPVLSRRKLHDDEIRSQGANGHSHRTVRNQKGDKND
eukprot:767876-Hanusia_phi.AAC.11